MRTQAAKRSSQFEDGEDKVASLEKQVKKVKSEKRAVEDVSWWIRVYCVQLYVHCVTLFWTWPTNLMSSNHPPNALYLNSYETHSENQTSVRTYCTPFMYIVALYVLE